MRAKQLRPARGLCLTRKPGEQVVLTVGGQEVLITVGWRDERTTLTFDADRDRVAIWRAELDPRVTGRTPL